MIRANVIVRFLLTLSIGSLGGLGDVAFAYAARPAPRSHDLLRRRSALSLGIEVPFVVLHHIVRVLLVVAGSAAVFALKYDPFNSE